MSNRTVNDIRRVILALCFFGLILSLIGTELPWVKIEQSSAQNPLYIVDKPSCNKTKNNDSYPTVNELKFKLDVFLTLASSQLCQTFTSGSLPSYIGGANLKDIQICTDLKFKEISNFMKDEDSWNSYASSCSSGGGGAFFLIIIALVIMAITMAINTFPKLVNKCCADGNSFKNKFIRSLIAFFAPALVTLALIIYATSCVNGDLGNVLTARKMSRSGAGGYWICCISCALLWIYWALFIFRMCDNEVQIKGADDIKAKFLGRGGRKETDIDDGMIDESQEHRETVMSGNNNNRAGSYDDGGYRQQEYDDDDGRKNTISAYEDNGISGGPSAGTWQDVEED